MERECAALQTQSALAVLGLVHATAALVQERKRQLEQSVHLLHMLHAPPRPPPTVRGLWVRPGRSRQWWDNFEKDEARHEDWLENFRMSRSSVLALCDELRPHLERKTTVMRVPISVLQQVACTLFYLRGEGKLSHSADAFGFSRTSVSNVVRRTCKAIALQIGSKYVKLPFSEPEVEELVSGFEKEHGIPQCLGVVDANHIEIKQPSAHSVDYSNKRGTFSLNVQAVCDFQCRFIDVVVKWPGSVNDSAMFFSSKVNAHLRSCTIPSKKKRIVDGVDAVPVFLIGGAAYPLLPYLMPVGSARESQKTTFEHRLGSAHNVINRAIGRLKARFCALKEPMNMNLGDLPYVIFACFVLSNFCDLNEEYLDENEVQKAMQHDKDTQPPKDKSGVQGDVEDGATRIKAALTKYMDS